MSSTAWPACCTTSPPPVRCSASPPPPEDPAAAGQAYRAETEAIIRETARTGGVILGRGAAIVLRDHPRAVHVRLTGPPGRRVAQLVTLGGLSPEEARRRQREADHLREAYVRHFCHADPTDPRHYHLVLDATTLPLAACVEAIVAAVRGLEAWELSP